MKLSEVDLELVGIVIIWIVIIILNYLIFRLKIKRRKK